VVAVPINMVVQMKELVLKYVGKSDAHFVFTNDIDEVMRFHHVRSDLIYEYQLPTDKFKNQRFKVKFFISEAEDKTTRIVSDMEIVGF